MADFFPRDVVHWADEHLHPLRAFSLRTLEMAGITGVLLRLFRVMVLGTSSLFALIAGVIAASVFLCGMLTWNVSNYPLRHWPVRVLAFATIEIAAELGMSTLLIGISQERIGSRLATWSDWWPLAGNTLYERVFLLGLYAMALALAVKLVRRSADKRTTPSLRT